MYVYHYCFFYEYDLIFIRSFILGGVQHAEGHNTQAMGLSMPANFRRTMLSSVTRYERAKDAYETLYDDVVIDVSAQGRNMMAPQGNRENTSMLCIGSMFVKATMLKHTATTKFVLCYDNPSLNPEIRSSVLYTSRYGPKYDAPPTTMNEATHVFADSTVDALAATLDQMLASSSGKKKLMMLHAEGVKHAVEAAFGTGELLVNATVVIVPPSGPTWVVTSTASMVEDRRTQYGEADMLIAVWARDAIDKQRSVCIRTIDTDILLQAPMYTEAAPDAIIDIHIATVGLDASGQVCGSKSVKTVRSREIVDVAKMRVLLKPESLVLALVYGGDYVKGLCIRGIGLPKKALFELIMKNTSSFFTSDASSVTIDWSAFFIALGGVCKAPKKPIIIDVCALNTEMQRLAYCLAYFKGASVRSGGPDVDSRPIIPDGSSCASLQRGEGLPTLTYG
jgi:hypothetical protein